jgi:hypothetical protein
MLALRRHGPSLLIWFIVSCYLVFAGWENIQTREGWDPDDQLRMVQLRDFLGGQSWFDTMQYRLNPPDGAPMHWSRLVELPLAAMVLLLTPLLGSAGAEMAAGAAVPLLCLGGIAFLLAGIAEKIGGRGAGIAAALLTLISPGLLLQLRPMRIDHHGWQIFCAVLALATLFWRDSRKAGLALGLALAIWLHISLEGAPITAAFFLILSWRWIVERNQGVRLFWTLSSFAGSSFALFVGTQGDGFAAQQYCDTISPAHIWTILVAVFVMIPAIYVKPTQRWQRIGAAAFAGLTALGVLFWLAPSCSQGAFGDLDPIVRQFWYANVKEGLPVWYQDPLAAMTLLTPLAVALIAFLFAYRFVEAADRPIFRQLGFFLIYASILSLLVFRTVSVATAFTIVPVACCLKALVHRYRIEPIITRRLGLVAIGLILMIPGPIAANLAQPFAGSSRAVTKGESLRVADQKKCESAASVKALSGLPTGNIVAPFDLGPTILLTTKHKVLASSHHRNARGMRDQIDILRLPPDQARPIMIRHNIAYLVVCLDEGELKNYVRKSPAGLWAQIDADNAPNWLEYQGTMGKGLKVWRVR